MDHRNALPHDFELDDYIIEETIGSGGFGIVYSALDRHLRHRVVIKEYLPNDLAVREGATTVLPKSSADNTTFHWGLERFMAEAQTLASFKHSNIVSVYRVFQAHNTAYMVMEDGGRRTLGRYLERHETLNQEQIEALLAPLLDALKTIHSKGFLHRDIKPDNILIRDDSTPLLIDFGAARQQVTGRTRPLTSIISTGYAPLEQYDSDSTEQGPWSDLYALGALLYRCVTGTRPPDATTRSLNDRLQPVHKMAKSKDYEPDLLSLIDWCLKMRPADRPQSVDEIMSRFGEAEPEASKFSSNKVEDSFSTASIIEGQNLFVISITKLITLFILTFGIYLLYWFWKHWQSIKITSGEKISPLFRAFFALFFVHALFRRMRSIISEHGPERKWYLESRSHAGWYVLLVMASWPLNIWANSDYEINIIDFLALVPFFLILIPLMPMQKLVNRLAGDPQGKQRTRYSGWDITFIVFGSFWWLMTSIGLLLTPYY